MRALLGGHAGIELIDPCGHAAMIALMREADLILSDSGGMQEEAPALGVPLLVLRYKTERPEGLASGNAVLVGTEPGRIRATVEQPLRDPVALAGITRRALPFGDGRSGSRIAGLIDAWLEAQRLRA